MLNCDRQSDGTYYDWIVAWLMVGCYNYSFLNPFTPSDPCTVTRCPLISSNSPDISRRNAITRMAMQNRQTDLEVKNHHSNQADVVLHMHSTYLPAWL